MPQDTDGRAQLEAARDRLVARLEKGHAEYFAGFGGERSVRLAREDPAGYRRAEDLWMALRWRYEAVTDQLSVAREEDDHAPRTAPVPRLPP